VHTAAAAAAAAAVAAAVGDTGVVVQAVNVAAATEAGLQFER
jgi:hypothetical protein